jgi:hypothetical protein
MKSFLKIVFLAPIFTVVLIVVIFCGLIFDLSSAGESAPGEQQPR